MKISSGPRLVGSMMDDDAWMMHTFSFVDLDHAARCIGLRGKQSDGLSRGSSATVKRKGLDTRSLEIFERNDEKPNALGDSLNTLFRAVARDLRAGAYAVGPPRLAARALAGWLSL